MFQQARNSACLDDFPVHLACRDGDVESLLKFVGMSNARSYLVAEDTFYHWTPIHWACFFGQLPALIVLREAGVAVDITTVKFQQTAAHIAAFAGADHCLKYLVHFGCNVNKQDYLGETPLHKSARSGSLACGRVLTGDGRALPHVVNSGGQTAAALAAVCGHPQMAAYLAQYERRGGQQEGACTVAAGDAGCCGAQPALNGGVVPERTAAADGPWCYQPPQRCTAAAGQQMDVEPEEGPVSAIDTLGPRQDWRFAAQRQGEPPPDVRCRSSLVLSASVGHQGSGDFDVRRQDNGFRKRCGDETHCEEFKRRRLTDVWRSSPPLDPA